jgi:hypothetical protein
MEEATMDANRKNSANITGGHARERRRTPSQVRDEAVEAARHVHRERDFGVGYGNSSGYADVEHFTDRHADPLFRLG